MDKIAKAISEALIKTKDSHMIGDEEAKKLAVIVATVAKSNSEIRGIFYSGVQIIATKIQETLKEQELAILKDIRNGKEKDDDILN